MSSSRERAGLGGMLLFGAASAVVGGIIAYRRHKQIEEIVESFNVTLDGEDFANFDEESIVHTVSDKTPEEDFVEEQVAEGELEDDFVQEPVAEPGKEPEKAE